MTKRLGKASVPPIKGTNMGRTGKKKEAPGKGASKSKQSPPPAPLQDDDYEDGDIATPKRDRYGTDDEPL